MIEHVYDPVLDLEDFADAAARRGRETKLAVAGQSILSLDSFGGEFDDDSLRPEPRESADYADPAIEVPITLPIAVSRLFSGAVDKEGNYRVVASGKINLADFAQRDRRTIVCADHVVVTGTVQTGGQAVTIQARVVEFAAGGSIDTSGAASVRTFAGVPAKATQPGYGSSGQAGESGGKGADGGGVLIIARKVIGQIKIASRGGAGGQPQNGGSGNDGRPGQDGQMFGHENLRQNGIPSTPSACDATWGGNGGAAGLPGSRGRGGNGGRVIVRTLEPLSTNPLIDTARGRHGAVGQAGSPGAAGRHGTPGGFSYTICEFISHEDMPGGYWSCNGDTVRVEGTRIGDQGGDGFLDRATLTELQKDPFSSEGVREILQVPLPQFAQQFPADMLDVLTWAMEDAYRQNGGLLSEEIAQLLGFLIATTTNDPQATPEKRDIMARVLLMQRKIGLGLDYYGYSLIDVPILSFDTYTQQVGIDFLQNLYLLEAATDRFEKATNDRTALVAAARQALAAATQNSTVAVQLLDFSIVQAKELAEIIVRAEADVHNRILELEKRRDNLNRAIQAKPSHEDCTLQNVILMAVAVYAIVQTAGAATAAIGEIGASLVKVKSYFELLDTTKELWENRSVLLKSLETIGKASDTLDNSFDALRKKVSALRPDQAQLPSFQMEKEQFDKVARDFADYVEAKAYREAGYAFLHAVEARNQSIIDFNASLLRVSDIQLQSLVARKSQDVVSSQLNRTANPAFDVIYRAMRRLYADALVTTAANVHRERKALGYSLNKYLRLEISELNAATIDAAHRKTRLDWQRQREQFNPHLPVNPRKLNFDLFDLIDGDECDAWHNFLTTGLLAFNMRIDHPKLGYRFANLPGLRMTGVQFVITGAKFKADSPVDPSEDQLFWDVQLSGLEESLTSSGERVHFRHTPVSISGSCSTRGQPGDQLIYSDFSAEGIYAGFSPFTQWRLIFRNFKFLDFSSVAQLQLFVSGYVS